MFGYQDSLVLISSKQIPTHISFNITSSFPQSWWSGTSVIIKRFHQRNMPFLQANEFELNFSFRRKLFLYMVTLQYRTDFPEVLLPCQKSSSIVLFTPQIRPGKKWLKHLYPINMHYMLNKMLNSLTHTFEQVNVKLIIQNKVAKKMRIQNYVIYI